MAHGSLYSYLAVRDHFEATLRRTTMIEYQPDSSKWQVSVAPLRESKGRQSHFLKLAFCERLT